jgi:hypothetical protein
MHYQLVSLQRSYRTALWNEMLQTAPNVSRYGRIGEPLALLKRVMGPQPQ